MNSNFCSKIPTTLLLAFGLLWVKNARADLISSEDLKYEVSTSNLIVRGWVTGVNDVKTGEVIKKCGHIAVSRILKGSWAKDKIDIFFTPAQANSIGVGEDILTEGDQALFFFKIRGQDLVPTDSQHIKFSVLDGLIPTTAQDADPLEKVREELLWSATPNLVYSGEDQATLEMIDKVVERMKRDGKEVPSLNGKPALRILGRPRPEPICIRAITQLGFLPPEPKTVLHLNYLLSQPNLATELRGRLIETLLRLDQKTALAPALEYIKDLPLENDNGAANPSAQSIASSIAYLSDPGLAIDLAALLSHPQIRVRRAAISALGAVIGNVKNVTQTKRDKVQGTDVQEVAKVHPVTLEEISPKILPILVKSLDDEDAEVRFKAILRLTEITSQPGKGPGYDRRSKDYKRSDEEPYIAYWKEWWAKQPKLPK